MLRGSLAVAIATGVALFLYDPVHVGSHAWFLPKLALLALALANAAAFHRGGYAMALARDGTGTAMPTRARLAGAVSLALWFGVMVFACLNTEEAPRLLLR